MKNRTKFYEILVKARTDEVSMILVIGKIMPLIDKYSLNEKKCYRPGFEKYFN